MDWSFQEKSILGSLVITLAAFGYYFLQAFKVFTGASSAAALSLPFVLIGVVAVVIVVEIVYQAVLAIRSRPEGADERDRLIEAKATRIAYFVLATGAVVAAGHALLSVFFTESVEARIVSQPVFTANLIIFSFILAEVVGFALQLYYYRRGV